jgi:hypothetical protein
LGFLFGGEEESSCLLPSDSSISLSLSSSLTWFAVLLFMNSSRGLLQGFGPRLSAIWLGSFSFSCLILL